MFRIMKERAHGTIYENKIELVSGQKFPDIVAHVNEQKAYGLEVKTTKSNSWQSIGSSIFEEHGYRILKNTLAIWQIIRANRI